MPAWRSLSTCGPENLRLHVKKHAVLLAHGFIPVDSLVAMDAPLAKKGKSRRKSQPEIIVVYPITPDFYKRQLFPGWNVTVKNFSSLALSEH